MPKQSKTKPETALNIIELPKNTKPEPPKWLGNAARHWSKIVEDLEKARVLHACDTEQIGLACFALENLLQAREDVAQFGRYFIAEKSGYQCINACATHEVKWWENYQNALQRLGLNAAGRKGIKAGAPGVTQSAGNTKCARKGRL
jgi:P27 family predicted phage terminase small subunit